MSLALMMSLQLLSQDTQTSVPRDFDLGKVRSEEDVPDKGCGNSLPGEILVCGSRRNADRYRYRELPDGFSDRALKVQTDVIEGIYADIHVESEEFPSGMISKRLMVTLKKRF